MKKRTIPAVECPRCHSPRTRVRFTRHVVSRAVIIRHRVCLKCKARWRTESDSQPERFAGMEAPAA